MKIQEQSSYEDCQIYRSEMDDNPSGAVILYALTAVVLSLGMAGWFLL